MNIWKWFRSRIRGLKDCPQETIKASLGVLVTANCGHQTAMRGTIGPEDDRREVTLTGNPPECCLDCLESAIIRCAWCGETIWPDEPITLYSPEHPKKFTPKPGSRIFQHKQHPQQFVGCLRWNCADSGADRAGFWVIPGKVKRCLSPLEETILNPDRITIISDISDIEQANFTK